jgi:hypothetical protein
MDFINYLAALRGPYTPETPMPRIDINTPADLFNPAAKDGALLWVGLRLIPVTLALSWVFHALGA